jgi:O-antigen/teichoic acid export membrane protein
LGAVCSAYLLLAAALVVAGSLYWLLRGGAGGSGIVLLVLLLVASQGLFDLSVELANAKQLPVAFGALAGSKALASVLIGSAFISLLGFGASGPILGISLGATLSVLFFSKRLWVHLWPVQLMPRLVPLLFRYGLPLSLAALLNIGVHGADRLLIAYMLGPADVGKYAAGFDLAQQSLGVLMAVLSLAYVPGIFQEFETQGSLRASSSLRSYGVVSTAVLLPATVGLALLAGNISAVILGPQFGGDASVLIPVVAVAILLSGYKAFYFDVAFQLAKRTRPQLWTAAAMAMFNIAMNLMLIPAYGVLGAAYASLAAYGIGLAISAFWGRRVFRMPLWDTELMKVVMATAILAASLLAVEHYRGADALALQVCVGCLTYALAMAAMRFRGFGNTAAAIRE